MIARMRLLFYCVFILTAAASMAIATWLHNREAATILLFLPLIWAFLTLSPSGMIISGVIVAVLRTLVEAVHGWAASGHVDIGSALTEPISPILLYVVLGLVFYGYRRRQKVLVARLMEAGTIEARDRLASSLTHDFNNILAVIIGTAEMLLRGHTADESIRNDIQVIYDAGQQGRQLILQMRAATRGADSGLVAEDLADLVDRQMDLIERILPQNIHVVRHSSGRLPVKADKGQMLRVLMNLCVNASAAMPAGGVLTVRTCQREIGGRHMAVLYVSDTGTGVDPAIMDRVFDPFFSTRTDGSTGLGLSIVRSIAASHNGKVEVENVPGAGASFSVAIPLDADKDLQQ